MVLKQNSELNAQISVPLGTHTSVLQIELMGIMLGARIIAEREIGNKSIRILTDSKFALLALNSCMVRSGLVWECRQTQMYITHRSSVELCWIKCQMRWRSEPRACPSGNPNRRSPLRPLE
ncbi:hypothetical protein Zmor_020837 [Zophobas morio]|uniref:Uncharacterized protein n=1 Tax=Zophobas morio TaxID=2755281 RepID=A0AA38I471_9CUCU|nr:hypothetical protein Zmor_020837 [Zophobas morio]